MVKCFFPCKIKAGFYITNIENDLERTGSGIKELCESVAERK